MKAFWNKKAKEKKIDHSTTIIDATIHEVRKAVSAFAEKKREGISLKVLVQDDNQIDTTLLAPYLGGIPSEPYFMSKETFELFEKHERHIPFWIDSMQRAVDSYVRSEKETPVIEGDPYRKISFYKLEKKALLHERPPLDFYLTEQEQMVSHRKPVR
ncbi:DUF3939 domain-containing protein [Pseudalkalibacillus hwajinpoensis]|uniref:DUF3939 domain-containing protein n=1 Tax=Guptibacillus hwajinpoensis TaxID=208199 RepID=UPI00325B967A